MNNKDKFVTINEWLNEQKEENEPTYGCVMMDSKIPDWEQKHVAGIDPKDVFIKPYDDSYGIEDNPHITILYGIHEDEIDPEIIMDVIKSKMEPVTVTISNISIFENDEYDVVKYDVPVTPQLKKYNELFKNNFPNTQTYPDYHPHMTLAYVKPGEGKKYVKKLDEPFEVTFDKGVYSFHQPGESDTTRKEYVFKNKEDEIDLTENLNLSNLKNKYPLYDLRISPSSKFRNCYSVSVYKNESYIGGIKGPVKEENVESSVEMIIKNDNH